MWPQNDAKLGVSQQIQGIKQLDDAIKSDRILAGFVDGPSYISIAGQKDFYLSQKEAKILMAIGYVLKVWNILPDFNGLENELAKKLEKIYANYALPRIESFNSRRLKEILSSSPLAAGDKSSFPDTAKDETIYSKTIWTAGIPDIVKELNGIDVNYEINGINKYDTITMVSGLASQEEPVRIDSKHFALPGWRRPKGKLKPNELQLFIFYNETKIKDYHELAELIREEIKGLKSALSKFKNFDPKQLCNAILEIEATLSVSAQSSPLIPIVETKEDGAIVKTYENLWQLPKGGEGVVIGNPSEFEFSIIRQKNGVYKIKKTLIEYQEKTHKILYIDAEKNKIWLETIGERKSSGSSQAYFSPIGIVKKNLNIGQMSELLDSLAIRSYEKDGKTFKVETKITGDLLAYLNLENVYFSPLGKLGKSVNYEFLTQFLLSPLAPAQSSPVIGQRVNESAGFRVNTQASGQEGQPTNTGGIDMQKIDVAAGPSSNAVNFSLPANFDPANLQISIKSIRLETMPKLGIFLNLVKEQEGQKNLQLASVK